MTKIESISDYEIAKARDVLDNHIPGQITHESVLETALFAIASAGTRWDKAPTRFIYGLRDASYPGDPAARRKTATLAIMADKRRVGEIAKANSFRFHHHNRFETIIDVYAQKNHSWWEEIINADAEVRDKYTDSESEYKIRGMSLKTFSFWHLCLGGKRLLPIDIWIRRKLKEDFGMELDEKHVIHTPRTAKTVVLDETPQIDLFGKSYTRTRLYKQNVTEEPNRKLYLEIETWASEYFGKDERFQIKGGAFNGKTDMGLVASVLWWRGAGRGAQSQRNLFVEYDGNSWIHPYAK